MFMCVMCVYAGVHIPWHTCGGQGMIFRSLFSPMGEEDWTQFIKLKGPTLLPSE